MRVQSIAVRVLYKLISHGEFVFFHRLLTAFTVIILIFYHLKAFA